VALTGAFRSAKEAVAKCMTPQVLLLNKQATLPDIETQVRPRASRNRPARKRCPALAMTEPKSLSAKWSK